MNYFLFGNVYNLLFDREISIENDMGKLVIVENHPLLLELLSDDFLEKQLGVIEIDNLKNNHKHFSMYRVNELDENSTDLVSPLISLQRYSTQTFFLSLWMIKDNAVNTGSFLWWHYETKDVISNRPAILFSNARGEYTDTFYSSEEIEIALDWQKKLSQYTTSENHQEIDNKTTSLFSNKIHNQNKQNLELNENRIKRSIRLINIARSQSFLPAKIASYISSIEALISSNRESLVMQVAERVPKILGGVSIEEKRKIHDKLRSAYGIRNKYVHGDKVTSKIASKLEETSEDIDFIARSLLIKMIEEYDHTKEYGETEMTKWYEENFMF